MNSNTKPIIMNLITFDNHEPAAGNRFPEEQVNEVMSKLNEKINGVGLYITNVNQSVVFSGEGGYNYTSQLKLIRVVDPATVIGKILSVVYHPVYKTIVGVGEISDPVLYERFGMAAMPFTGVVSGILRRRWL